jgi:hypothetical protein
MDITTWSSSDALNYPLPNSCSVRFPLGLVLSQVLATDPLTGFPSLMSEAQIRYFFANAAPTRVWTAVRNHCIAPTTLGHQLLSLLLPLPLSSPLPPPSIPFLNQLIVANVPLCSLSTATARRFLDVKARTPAALDWNRRAISRLGLPPEDIWTRLWRGPSLPSHRQTWYKLLLNALPLGTRIEEFAPDDVDCPFCKDVPQTLRHFILTCPMAQAVWREFATVFDLPFSPSLQHCLYSWPSSSSSYLGRAYGYRLQAGHAVALHLLWVIVVQARFDGTLATPASLPSRLRFLLRQHFLTLSHSSRWGHFFSPLFA